MASRPNLWTIGHSNHAADRLVSLLQHEKIEFVVDVRSYPYSSFAPHFDTDTIKETIASSGMAYVFMGSALGGRPDREDHYDAEGHALYDRMAAEPAFGRAIQRLLQGASAHRLCLMCSCGRPDDCHRRLLVGKVLCEHGAKLRHVLPNGQVSIEMSVDFTQHRAQGALFSDDAVSWRSARSVSHRRRLKASSPA